MVGQIPSCPGMAGEQSADNCHVNAARDKVRDLQVSMETDKISPRKVISDSGSMSRPVSMGGISH